MSKFLLVLILWCTASLVVGMLWYRYTKQARRAANVDNAFSDRESA